jgi:hypothetical protein
LLRVSEDGYGDQYRQQLFDQYKLVVEMGGARALRWQPLASLLSA